MFKREGLTYSKRIRTLLRLPQLQEGDGLTINEIADRLDNRSDTTRDALKRMPDAYIAKWDQCSKTARPSSFWKVVIPPPDAKPPAKKWTKKAKLKS